MIVNPAPMDAASGWRVEAERKAAAEAQKIVEIWNARWGAKVLWFYPTIGAAIAGGMVGAQKCGVRGQLRR